MNDSSNSQSETVIPLKDIETALDSVRAVRAKMTFLSALTPKERKNLPSVTPTLLGLMEDAVQAARENPGILPSSMSLEDYASEVQACRALHGIRTHLQELLSGVQDTLLTLGREANGTTQQVRAIVRTAAATKPTPGLKLLARRLSRRPGRTESSAAEEPTVAGAIATPVLAPSVLAVQTVAPAPAPTVVPAPVSAPEPKAA